MASSQVEIATSNPFVCILKNQMKTPSQSKTFHKNLKGLARDRLHTRASVSPESSPSDDVSTWIRNRDKDNPTTRIDQRQSGNQETWATIDVRSNNNNQEEDLVAPPSPTPLLSTSTTSQSEPSSPSKTVPTVTTPVSAPNRGASSLVQIWEARLGRSASMISRSSSSNNSSSSSCNFPLTNSQETPSNDEFSGQLETLGRTKSNESMSCSEQTSNSRPNQKSKIVENESDPNPTLRPRQKSKVVVGELDCPAVSAGSSSCSGITCVPSQKRKIVEKESEQSILNESSYCLKLTSRSSQRPKKVSKESDQTGSIDSCSEVTSNPSHRIKTDGEDSEPTDSNDSSSCSERASRPRQRPKIADLIRRLMAANSSNSKKTTNSASRESPRTYPDLSEKAEAHLPIDRAEGSDREFVPNINQCPRLRGRQAFNDLLLMMEHDRYSELGVLGERKAVSGFSHKGRIQSLLRLKILQRGLSLQDGWRPHSRLTKPNHDDHGSTVHLRDKSTTANDQIVHPKDDDIGSSSHPHSSESSSPKYKYSVISIPADDVPEPPDDVPEPPDSYSEWYPAWPLEEEEEGDDDEEEVNNGVEDTASERFLGVARPRSYWDDRRKAWYRQILAAESDDSEIRELLQRRTVSNVLTTESDFHHRMNYLMRSHVERQIHGINNEEDDQIPTCGIETMRRFLSSYLQQQSESLQSSSHESGEPEHVEADGEHEHGDREDEDEEEDEDMYLRRQERMQELISNRLQVGADSTSSHEDDDEAESINVHQNTSSSSTQSSPMRNNSDGGRVPVMSESLQGGSDSVAGSYPPRDNVWSVDRVSVELEIINELRGQMKQLYQEMSELRRCVSNCIDVQVKFQDSMKKEMMTAVRGGLSRTEEGGQPRKGYCCICYEMKVNSLLYRCGHMCTCLECAYELQRGSGKCPICRSTIMDVVKAYTEM